MIPFHFLLLISAINVNSNALFPNKNILFDLIEKFSIRHCILISNEKESYIAETKKVTSRNIFTIVFDDFYILEKYIMQNSYVNKNLYYRTIVIFNDAQTWMIKKVFKDLNNVSD